MPVTANEIMDFVGAIIGGGVAVAVINCANDRWKLRQQRKAQLEDRAEEKSDKTDDICEDIEDLRKAENAKNKEIDKKLEELTKKVDALCDAQKIIMLDRIRWMGQKYIDDGEVTFDDRRILHMMHNSYHYGLNGNGDADLIMQGVDGLSLKSPRKGEVRLNVHHHNETDGSTVPCTTRCCDAHHGDTPMGK